MSQLDKPNFVVPLAVSYDERGVDGAASSFTSGLDQKKVNCVYEPVINSFTGKRTLKVVRRPGCSDSAGGTTAGTTSEVPYLVAVAPGFSNNVFSGANQWVVSKNGNDIKVADTSATITTVLTSASYQPTYIDKTAVTGTETIILELTQPSNTTHRVYYSTAIGTFTEITDAQFTGLNHAGKSEFLDGYMLKMTTNNRIYNSDLNSVSAWTADQYTPKNIQQDNPAGLARLGQIVLAFGENTVEAFYNAGNASGSPLGRLPQLNTKIGLGGQMTTFFRGTAGVRHYYAEVGGKLYFQGQEAGGLPSRGIYAFNGSRFEKVSTIYIEKLLSDGTVYAMWPFGINGKIGLAISLSGVSTNPQRWLMFFPDVNDWFEWTSAAFQPANSGANFLGIGGLDSANKLARFEGSTVSWQDTLGTITSLFTETIQFKIPQDGNHRKRMIMAGVIGDTSTSASTLNAEFSDDDGVTWSTARGIDMTQINKKQIYRCGSFGSRFVRLTHASNNECRLEKFIARIDD